MLKPNSKWKALEWQLRAFLIAIAVAVFVWWPSLNLFLNLTNISIHAFGFWLWLLTLLAPFWCVGLFIAYKEWFTDVQS